MAAVCIKCQTALSPSLSPALDSPSTFEIDFARALLTGKSRGREETRSALEELVRRFDVVAQRLLNARATNHELETSLKIARSNLVLAEANTEALEETLRRRAPTLAPASFPGAAASTGLLPRLATPDANLWGDPLLSSPSETPGEEHQKNSISAFFRRKRLNASSPLINSPSPGPDSSDFPALPLTPNESELSVDLGAEPGGERTTLSRRLDHLTALLANERVATNQLRNSHADLMAERDKLNEAHNEMQGELENLSAALFEEANKMVATERQRVAECEQEIYDLRNEVEALRRGTETGALDAEPSTARPYLPDSSPSVATDLSPAMSQRTGDSYSRIATSSEASPVMPKSDTSSPQVQLSSTSSPALALSPVSSSPGLAETAENPGRQWLKSFNTRRQAANRQAAVEDALASISPDGLLGSKPAAPLSGDASRQSVALDDNDLLPTSVTPSPGVSPSPAQAELPAMNGHDSGEDDTEIHSRTSRREYTISEADDDLDRRSRTTSYESWNKRSTASSFATPNIEAAFLASPPVPALPRQRASVGARSERSSNGRARSPRRSSSRNALLSSPPPPEVPALSPVYASANDSNRSPDPAYSEPLLQSATFSRSEGSLPSRHSSATSRSAHLSQSSTTMREKKPRPAPLQFKTPPLASVEQMPAVEVERVPTPKSARRGGLVLGLDSAQLFPHRGPEAAALPEELRGDEREVRTTGGASKQFAQALGYTAPNGRGVGLLRQVPRPETPVSPMARDLDALLDELSQINDELTFSSLK